MMLLAQGTPMLLAGDEFGNTQEGNNNPYCQDNEITWLDWRYDKCQDRDFRICQKADRIPQKAPGASSGKRTVYV